MINFLNKGGIDTSDATATVNDVINPKTFYNANGIQVGGIAVVKEINDELKSISLTSDVQITTGPVFLFSDGKHIMAPCMINNIKSFAIGVYDITNRTFKSIPNMIRTYDELNIASGAGMMDSDLSRQESGTGNYYLIAKNKTNGNSYSLVAINFSTNTFEFKAQTTPESNTTYSAIFNPAIPNVFYYSKYDDWQYSTALAKRYDASTSSIVNINSSRHYGKAQSGWMRISQDGRLLVRSKQNDSGTVGYVLSTVDGGLRNTFGAGAGKLGITPDSKYMVCSSGIYSMTINGDTVTSTQLNTVNLPSRSWVIDYFFLGNTNKLLSSSGSVFDLYDVDYDTGNYTLLDTVNYNSYSKSAPFPYMALNTGSTIALYGYFSTDTILQLTRDGKNLYYTAKDSDVISADILSGKIAYGASGKITGTMLNNGALNYTPSTSQQTIPSGYTSGGTISAVDNTIDSNIVAENIRSGVTILGVSGELDGGSGDVKLFSTVEEMQDDTNPQKDDLAVVYRSTLANPNPGDTISSITFPDTVTFDTAITTSKNGGLSGNNVYIMLTLNATYFNLRDWSGTITDYITYTSSDGKTYTRTDSGSASYDLGEEITIGSGIDTDLLKFIQVGGNYFEGLYKYATGIQTSYIKVRDLSTSTINIADGVITSFSVPNFIQDLTYNINDLQKVINDNASILGDEYLTCRLYVDTNNNLKVVTGALNRIVFDTEGNILGIGTSSSTPKNTIKTYTVNLQDYTLSNEASYTVNTWTIDSVPYTCYSITDIKSLIFGYSMNTVNSLRSNYATIENTSQSQSCETLDTFVYTGTYLLVPSQ